MQTCGTDSARCSLWVEGLGGRLWLARGGSALYWFSVLARVGCHVAIGSALCGRCWLLVGSGWRLVSPAWVLMPLPGGRRRQLGGPRALSTVGSGFLRRGIGLMRTVVGCLGSGAAGVGCVLAGSWGCDRSFRVAEWVATGASGSRDRLRPAGCCMMAGMGAAFGDRGAAAGCGGAGGVGGPGMPVALGVWFSD